MMFKSDQSVSVVQCIALRLENVERLSRTYNIYIYISNNPSNNEEKGDDVCSLQNRTHGHRSWLQRANNDVV